MFPLSKEAWSQLCNVALLNNVKKRTRFRFHSPGAEVERPWERFWERLLKEESGIYFVIMLTKSTANIQCTEVLLFLAEDGLGCECGTFLNSIMPIPKYFLLLIYFSPKVFNDVRKSV